MSGGQGEGHRVDCRVSDARGPVLPPEGLSSFFRGVLKMCFIHSYLEGYMCQVLSPEGNEWVFWVINSTKPLHPCVRQLRLIVWRGYNFICIVVSIGRVWVTLII